MGSSTTERASAELFAEPLSKRLALDDTPWTVPAWTDQLAGFNKQTCLWVSQQYNIIRQAQRDGIEHVAPILVALGCEPAVAKKRVGPASWRHVHHSPLGTNLKRANALLRSNIPLADLIAFPTKALPGVPKAAVRYSTEAVVYAGHVATNTREFREAVMLAHDAAGMGVNLNLKWSLKRLSKEHDRAAMEVARRSASDVPWQEPWSTEVDGFTFTLLRSARDFSAEALMQRHCIASYIGAARQGSCYVMKIEGLERATVRFYPVSISVAEVKALYNGEVSHQCYKACVTAGKLFKQNPSHVVLLGESAQTEKTNG